VGGRVHQVELEGAFFGHWSIHWFFIDL
jgi:hypothetical protein